MVGYRHIFIEYRIIMIHNGIYCSCSGFIVVYYSLVNMVNVNIQNKHCCHYYSYTLAKCGSSYIQYAYNWKHIWIVKNTPYNSRKKRVPTIRTNLLRILQAPFEMWTAWAPDVTVLQNKGKWFMTMICKLCKEMIIWVLHTQLFAQPFRCSPTHSWGWLVAWPSP